MTRSSTLDTTSSYCTIYFAKAGSFTGDELYDIRHDLETFTAPLHQNETFKTENNDDRQLKFTFECNSQALSLIHDHLYRERSYEDDYSVTVDFYRL